MTRKLQCALTGEPRQATPEEYVRQWAICYLMHLGYRREQMVAEYKIKVGSQVRRVDVAVFALGSAMRQEDMILAVECKRQGVPASVWAGAREQCESYLAASPNCYVGVLTDGHRTQAFRKGYNRDGNRRSAWTFVDLACVPSPQQVPEGATIRAASRAPEWAASLQHMARHQRVAEVALAHLSTQAPPPAAPLFLAMAVVCGGAALIVFVGLVVLVLSHL